MAALAIDLDIKEQFLQESHLGEGDGNVSHGGDDDEDANLKGWSDVRAEFLDEEREVLDKSLQPVPLVLVKASYHWQ